MCSDRRSFPFPHLIAFGASIVFVAAASARRADHTGRCRATSRALATPHPAPRARPGPVSRPPPASRRLRPIGRSSLHSPLRPSWRPRPPPAQPQRAAQPAAADAQAQAPRRAQASVSAQAAAACMNEEKSASVDTAIKGCDAVIGETMKNLANAYYFRGIAKFGKSDFDGAIGDYGHALQLDPADPDYLNSRAAAHEAKKDVDRASPTTTRQSRPAPIRSTPTTIAARSINARATSPAPPLTTAK